MIGLAPMDGITDAAYRQIADQYGHPDIIFTEFVNVDGLLLGKTRIYNQLVYHQTDTPIVAQLFGSNPDYFYKATLIVCALGFSGVDINMGCPDKNVIKRGGGAGLINQPKLAQEIVKTVKQAAADWFEGAGIDKLGLRQETAAWIKKYQESNKPNRKNDKITISVKTRLGFNKIITQDWISYLLESKLDFITLHGRIFKQFYSGKANWEEIARAVELSKNTKTKIIGNGDIKSKKEAEEKIMNYGVAGVLIGRAALGNPWVFQNKQPSLKERFKVMREHCQAFVKLTPDLNFLSLRKHLLWYLKGVDNSHQLKKQLVKVKNLEEVINLINSFINNNVTS